MTTQPALRHTIRRSFAALGLALCFLAAACSQVEVTTAATDAEPTTPSTLAATDAEEPGAGQIEVTTTDATTTTGPTTTEPTTTTTLAIDELPLPIDAAGVATELSIAELAVRDPSITDDDVGPYGRRQQQMYRIISANPDWAPEVIAAVDPAIRPAVELNWSARQDLSALVRNYSLSETLPAWRIRDPLPVAELVGYYEESEANSGIDWNYIAAINLVETRMGRIEGLSTAGATGPMQFLPTTWNECCQGDPTIDRDAIIGAGVYLRQRGGPADMQSALFGYNNSQRYVDAVSAYAEVIAADPLAYRGYHAWEVYFLSAAGLIRMPSGYEEPEPVDAAEWLADNPSALVGTAD